jgi:phage baseplate assembly protein W
MSEQFLGNGLAFPLQLGAAGLAQSAGQAKVDQSIRIILGTQHGERVMRPEFGGNLRALVFAPNNASTANLARYYVTEALTRWEPRIDVLDVAVTNDNVGAALSIEIRYRMRATGDAHNLVFTLNLEGGQ